MNVLWVSKIKSYNRRRKKTFKFEVSSAFFHVYYLHFERHSGSQFPKSPDTDGRQKLLRDYDYARPIKKWLRLVVHSDSR